MTTTTEDKEGRMAARVLDILDRWDDRLSGHQNQKREHPRRKYRSRVTVYIPETDGMAGECVESTSFDVWSRNLSQSGMAFIYQGQIKTKKVVICLNPDTGGTHWFQAEIVRQRQVHNDYWEYGTRFTGPAQI